MLKSREAQEQEPLATKQEPERRYLCATAGRGSSAIAAAQRRSAGLRACVPQERGPRELSNCSGSAAIGEIACRVSRAAVTRPAHCMRSRLSSEPREGELVARLSVLS